MVSGHMLMWKVGKMFAWARIEAMGGHAFLGTDILFKEHRVFVLVGEYVFEKNFHQYLYHHRENPQSELVLELMTYGRSSLVLDTSLVKQENNELLGKYTFKYVLVSNKTRKSAPLPEWFTKKYDRKVDVNSFRWIQPLSPPVKTHLYQATVTESYIDWNNHANHAFYMKVSMEAAEQACARGFFIRYHGDFLKYTPHKMAVLYSKECMLGSKLNVLTWEADDETDVIYFQISKEDEILFHSSLELYSSTAVAAL